MKYRKKFSLIDAVIFEEIDERGSAIFETIEDGPPPSWLVDALNFRAIRVKNRLLPSSQRYLVIETLEGEVRVYPGDYVIYSEIDGIYSSKPDVFKATYEPA